MNQLSFMAQKGPILVDASASGPSQSLDFRLILDTGATTTLLNEDVVRSLGYDPDLATDSVEFATTSGMERRPLVTLNRLTTFGRHRLGFRVICHSLPLGPGIDGLLGLDFFRDHVLTIDFRAGQLTLD